MPTDRPAAELARRWQQKLHRELLAAVELRHEVHAWPERSGQEARTARRIAGVIDAPVDLPVAGTGRLLRLGPPGPAVALRAELDALPGQEVGERPWRSQVDGTVHACGHDIHLAALSALARAARELPLPYGLVLLLQPREELSPSGARDIVTSGVLAEQDVRAVLGAHVQPRVAAGAVAADPGVVNAGVDEFTLTMTGLGGHSAYPHLARDPVAALCRAVDMLAGLVPAVVDPMTPAVLAVTMLSAGTAPNMIPGSAVAQGTLRTFEPADRLRVHERARAVVSGAAAAYGCVGDLDVTLGEPRVDNDAALTSAVRHRLAADAVPLAAQFRSCGSDDFAEYGTAAPSLMMFVGADGGADRMLHHPGFVPPDETVGLVARSLLAGYLGATDLLG